MESKDAPKEEKARKLSVADELVILAKIEYDVVMTHESDFLAIPRDKPRIAIRLESPTTGLSGDLALRYREETGRIPSDRAISDAIRVLRSEAAKRPPVRSYKRCARYEGNVYIDLGDPTSSDVIEVSADGWRIIDSPPVVFHRTKLTGKLVRPKRGGDFSKLFEFLNIPKEQRPLVLGFVVATYFEGIPHPILGLNGEQGSGKSGTSRRIVSITDPSPVPLQSPPRDKETWITLASSSWVISLDNLSKIPEWFSDSLCRASTGEGSVTRKLYEDKEVSYHSFLRVVILNGINLSSMRDDLADRVIPIYLPRLSSKHKKYDEELDRDWNEALPEIFGGLLDLCSKVLSIYQTMELDEIPRMADFARILKAIDVILGTDSLPRYLEEIKKSASNSADEDSFLKWLKRSITCTWQGSSSELFERLKLETEYNFDKSLPTSARAVTEKLARSGPILRRIGWEVDKLGSNNQDKVVKWRITPPTGDAGVTGNIFQLHTKSKIERNVSIAELAGSTPAIPAIPADNHIKF